MKSTPATARRSNRIQVQTFSSPRTRSARNGNKEPRNGKYPSSSHLLSAVNDSDENSDRDSANVSSDEDDGGLTPVTVRPFVRKPVNGIKGRQPGATDIVGESFNTSGLKQAENATFHETNADGLKQTADLTARKVTNSDASEWAADEDESEDSSVEEMAFNEERESEDGGEQAPGTNTSTERIVAHSSIARARKRKSPAISGSRKVRPKAKPDQARRDSLFEESEEEVSDEASAVDHDMRSQKQRRTETRSLQLDHVEITTQRKPPTPFEPNNQSRDNPVQSRVQRREALSPNPGLDEEQSEHDPSPPRDSPKSNMTAQSAVEADTGPTGAVPRHEGARNLGRRKGDRGTLWQQLKQESESLKGKADGSMARYFKDIDSLIRELHDTYTNMRTQLADGRSISIRAAIGCDNLRRAISTEGIPILDKVWSLSNVDREDRACNLLLGFETRVVPAMADLIYCCYQTCCVGVGEGRFPNAYRQLHGTMLLLLSFCNRVSNQIKTNVVRTKMLSRTLELALRKLIKALESGSLNIHVSVPAKEKRRSALFQYGDDSDSSSDIDTPAPPPRKWTDEEEKTLVNALELHQGMFLTRCL